MNPFAVIPSERKYAPASFLPPSHTVSVDRSVFKQSDNEKGRVLSAKLNHKRTLQKAYGNKWKKFLNTPENTLSEPIKMTF